MNKLENELVDDVCKAKLTIHLLAKLRFKNLMSEEQSHKANLHIMALVNKYSL